MELLKHDHRLSVVVVKASTGLTTVIGDAVNILRRVFFVDTPGFAGTAITKEVIRLHRAVFLPESFKEQLLPQSGDSIVLKITANYGYDIDGEAFEFSEGFTELHTESYRDILSGGGFGIEDARMAINTVYDIRNAEPIGLKGDYHPLAALPLAKHPFGW